MSNTELESIRDKFTTVKNMRTTIPTSRLEDSLFSKELAPHYMNLASKLATSSLVPKSFQGKPHDLFICWAMGYQIGLSPEQSMQCIAVINGRPAMWGDDMLALCRVHPDFEDILEEPILKGEAVIGYTCTVKRRGQTDTINPFTLEMAKKAGLLGKPGPWTQYPERMLKLRARGFSLRDAFPDALKGIKPREEIEDYIDVEYKHVEGSRTEFLKKDILKEDDPPLAPVSNIPTDCEDTGEIGAKPIEPEPAQEVTALSPYQAKQIFTLIADKGFTEDRVQKALKYYEVEALSLLSSNAAEHFIAQLTKLENTI